MIEDIARLAVYLVLIVGSFVGCAWIAWKLFEAVFKAVMKWGDDE